VVIFYVDLQAKDLGSTLGGLNYGKKDPPKVDNVLNVVVG
jgi:hypothetical protein